MDFDAVVGRRLHAFGVGQRPYSYERPDGGSRPTSPEARRASIRTMMNRSVLVHTARCAALNTVQSPDSVGVAGQRRGTEPRSECAGLPCTRPAHRAGSVAGTVT